MNGDDHDLYKFFAAVRREEEARVPAFTRISPTPPKHVLRRTRGRLILATACLAVMFAAAILLVFGPRLPHPASAPKQAAASLTSWRPATDFLLDTPNRDFLQRVPTVGEWHGAVVARAPGDWHHRSRIHVSQ